MKTNFWQVARKVWVQLYLRQLRLNCFASPDYLIDPQESKERSSADLISSINELE
jgi:hypothetical protein